jgi:predicted transcriptional regulator
LLSVHPRFADAILAGTKRVELRRRFPHVADNAKVFIYETFPTMAIVGSFSIGCVVRLELGPLWRQVKDDAGITREEYDKYFGGLSAGVGIFVRDFIRLRRHIGLDELRAVWPMFHPPQGFRYLDQVSVETLTSLATICRKAA